MQTQTPTDPTGCWEMVALGVRLALGTALAAAAQGTTGSSSLLCSNEFFELLMKTVDDFF